MPEYPRPVVASGALGAVISHVLIRRVTRVRATEVRFTPSYGSFVRIV